MIVVVAAIVAFGIGITGLVGSSLNRFTASLPEYTQRLNDYTHAVEDWLNNRGVPFDARELRNLMDASRVMRLAADIFNSFGGVLTNAFLIFLTVVFILFEMGSFAMTPPRTSSHHTSAWPAASTSTTSNPSMAAQPPPRPPLSVRDEKGFLP